ETYLKLAISRVQVNIEKKTNFVADTKKEIANLFQNKKTDLAMIKCESLIRSEDLVLCLEHLIVVIEVFSCHLDFERKSWSHRFFGRIAYRHKRENLDVQILFRSHRN
ncbi:hypothetical protein MHBO_003291, partial [Bonamia ostreae]